MGGDGLAFEEGRAGRWILTGEPAAVGGGCTTRGLTAPRLAYFPVSGITTSRSCGPDWGLMNSTVRFFGSTVTD